MSSFKKYFTKKTRSNRKSNTVTEPIKNQDLSKQVIPEERDIEIVVNVLDSEGEVNRVVEDDFDEEEWKIREAEEEDYIVRAISQMERPLLEDHVDAEVEDVSSVVPVSEDANEENVETMESMVVETVETVEPVVTKKKKKKTKRITSPRLKKSKKKKEEKEKKRKKYEEKISRIEEDVNSKEEEVEVEVVSYDDSQGNDFMGNFEFEEMDINELGDNDFKCLSPEQIITVQKKQISEIAELLHVTPSVAGNLLRHYQWKTEKLFAVYFEDPSKVWNEVGLDPDSEKNNKEYKLKGKGECLVCFDEFRSSMCTALMCKHRLCKDCWKAYLTVKINEGDVQKIYCPARDCPTLVPEESIKKLVDEPIYEKYIRFITKSFVEDNDQVSWCPAPNCGNAITADMMNGITVQCSCGYRFCFSCHNEAHTPCTCERVREWLRKCMDESETGHWVTANTKDCPKCHIAVEKNGGCNHMTCRQCGYEWCWLCMKTWKGHNDYYACSKYEKLQKRTKKKGKKSKLEIMEEEKEEKRISLERYLSHYHPYLTYEQHLKNTKDFRERTQEKIKQLRSQTTISFDLKYLEKGIETVLECYLVLKYGYVHSFFMIEDDLTSKKEKLNRDHERENKKKRNIFERKKKTVISPNFIPILKEYDPKKNLSIGFFIFLLNELEIKTNNLFDVIEKAVPDPEERKKTVALILYCDKLKQNLLQTVQLFDEGIYNLDNSNVYELGEEKNESL